MAAAVKVGALIVTILSFLWPVSSSTSTPPPPLPPLFVFNVAPLLIAVTATIPSESSMPPPPLPPPLTPDVQCGREERVIRHPAEDGGNRGLGMAVTAGIDVGGTYLLH